MAKKLGMLLVDVPLVAMKFKSFSNFTFVCFVLLTLKDAGGGVDSIHWSGDRLPFLTGSYYGHKIS